MGGLNQPRRTMIEPSDLCLIACRGRLVVRPSALRRELLLTRVHQRWMTVCDTNADARVGQIFSHQRNGVISRGGVFVGVVVERAEDETNERTGRTTGFPPDAHLASVARCLAASGRRRRRRVCALIHKIATLPTDRRRCATSVVDRTLPI